MLPERGATAFPTLLGAEHATGYVSRVLAGETLEGAIAIGKFNASRRPHARSDRRCGNDRRNAVSTGTKTVCPEAIRKWRSEGTMDRNRRGRPWARPSVERLSYGLIDTAVTVQASRETMGSNVQRPTRGNARRSSAGRAKRLQSQSGNYEMLGAETPMESSFNDEIKYRCKYYVSKSKVLPSRQTPLLETLREFRGEF